MIKTIFYRDVKKVKENKPKIQNRFYATDLPREPSPLSYVSLRESRYVLRTLSNTQGGPFCDNSFQRL